MNVSQRTALVSQYHTRPISMSAVSTPRHVRKAEARLTGKVSFRTEILERAQTDKFCDCKLSVSEYEAD